MKLLIASSNQGKLRDFQTAALRFGVELDLLPGLHQVEAPEETADSFEGNARLKAEFYSRLAPGELILADDSGLEVDALDGAPGVRSARYASDCGFDGPGSVDERNNTCLLQAMQQQTNRKARYRCVLAVARNGTVLYTADGSVEGEILPQPAGGGGFGYDPFFWLPARGLTMAQIDQESRQDVSHRGRALVSLLQAMGAQQRA